MRYGDHGVISHGRSRRNAGTYAVKIRLVNAVGILDNLATSIELLGNGEEVLRDVGELATIRDFQRPGVFVNVFLTGSDLVRFSLLRNIRYQRHYSKSATHRTFFRRGTISFAPHPGFL